MTNMAVTNVDGGDLERNSYSVPNLNFKFKSQLANLIAQSRMIDESVGVGWIRISTPLVLVLVLVPLCVCVCMHLH